jgi:hypothetical protein
MTDTRDSGNLKATGHARPPGYRGSTRASEETHTLLAVSAVGAPETAPRGQRPPIGGRLERCGLIYLTRLGTMTKGRQ